jgi:hypothetical protein
MHMAKIISHTQLTETLGLTECKDGFWLYDKTRSMNLSIRAPTLQDAFVEALTYYQRRLADVERAHASLTARVDAFVSQIKPDEIDEE